MENRIRIIIIDEDVNYCRSIADYISINSKFGIDVSVIYDINDFIEYKNCERHKRIILINEKIFVEKDWQNTQDFLLILAEEKYTAVKGRECIFKYGKPSEILAKIFLYLPYSLSETSPNSIDDTAFKSAAFCSGAGGTGKTTLAVGLSLQASLEGRRTFYLNMENVPTPEMFFSGRSDKSSADIFYYLSGEKELWVPEKIKQAITEDPVSKVNYFKSPEHLIDLQCDFKCEGNIFLLNLLNQCGYRFIAIDFSAGFSKRHMSLLPLCDDIFLIYGDDYISQRKTEILLKEFLSIEENRKIKLAHKIKLINNKRKSMNETPKSDMLSAKTFYTISYQENLPQKDKDIKPAILEGSFGTSIYEICRDIFRC